MKTWGRLSGKQHYWSFNSEMEVIISLKTLKVSENSWVFSSALLWSMYISSPSLNIFSSWIATLANLVGRDPIHSSFGKMQYTSLLIHSLFTDYSKSLVSGYASENRRKYYWNAVFYSVWGYCFVWALFTISRGMGINPDLSITLLTRSSMTLSRSETAALSLNL